MTQKGDPTHYDFIDALRCFAILAVIVLHTGLYYEPKVNILRMVITNGSSGVQLFYIVSALTLFLSLSQRSINTKADLRDFFIRRFFRIAPLFYLAIAVYSIYFFADAANKTHLGVQGWQWFWTPGGIQWWDYALTLSFLNGWTPETINAIIPVGWSVAVEMTFYIFVPLLYAKIKNVKTALAFLLAALVLQNILFVLIEPGLAQIYYRTVYLSDNFFRYWFFAQLPIFGLGILTFHLFQLTKGVRDRSMGLVLLGLAFFLLFAVLAIKSYNDLLTHDFLVALTFVPLTLGLYHAPIRLLVNPLTKWIGRISFSIYLIHFLVLDALVRLLPDGFPVSKTLGYVLALLTMVFVSTLISSFTYQFIEAPGMKAGKLLINRLQQRDKNFPVLEQLHD